MPREEKKRRSIESTKREISDLIESLKLAQDKERDYKRPCTLLIGTGCSASADIPTASGFVEIIEQKYPSAYNQAKGGRKEIPSYQACMAELTDTERHDLIFHYVDKAEPNWAHICIALLMKEGVVDRVLTVNFDPLLLKACALLGFVPAVYDLATSQTFAPEVVRGRAVFYLHGIATGPVLLNIREEFEKRELMVSPVLKEGAGGRFWIVAGYSGDNDPVFNALAQVPKFYKLYWLVNGDKEPAKHIQNNLLVEGKNTFWLNGFDADSLFMTLTIKLDLFPPAIIVDPLTHIDNLLDKFPSGKLPGQERGRGLAATARRAIKPAIISDPQAYTKKRLDQFLAGQLPHKELLLDLADTPRGIIRRARKLLASEAAEIIPVKVMPGPAELEKLEAETRRAFFSGDYEKVLALAKKAQKGKSASLSDTEAWAYVMQGLDLLDQAKTKRGPEADKLFKQAYEKYKTALEIKGDMHEAYNNWGLTLVVQADMKRGKAADRLFEQAYEKYEAAQKIKPDKDTALLNLGLALASQGRTKSGPAADKLFDQAYQKFQAAIETKKDPYEALSGWGHALALQAQTKEGHAADDLLKQAYDKFEAALDLKPEGTKALYFSYGLALFIQATTKKGVKKDELLEEARTKFHVAEEIEPGLSSYWLAVLAALRRDEDQTRQWLEKRGKRGAFPCDELAEEPVFDPFRAKKWFKDFMAQVCPED